MKNKKIPLKYNINYYIIFYYKDNVYQLYMHIFIHTKLKLTLNSIIET